MRYIDTSGLSVKIEPTWNAKARRALAEVRAATEADRADVLSRHNDVWGDLKLLLWEAGLGKCWYCESREIRSDGAVDHFRPKNRVADDKNHPGYWWLAFDWQNYRFSCTYCNSRRRGIYGHTKGGKADLFPLVNAANRALPEADPSSEEPILLDPARGADTVLLSFDSDGTVVPRYLGSGSLGETRAKISIEAYHLFEEQLVDVRRELFNLIKNLVDLGKTFHLAWLKGDLSAETAFNTAYEELQKKAAARSEFSTAAREMIRGLRHSDHPWIDTIC